MANNEMQWSSATPGLLIIMIDQSGSMLSPYEGETRTSFATKAVNRVIYEIIQKNFKGSEPKNRCFITVIGYNHNVKNIVSGYLDTLNENPIRIDRVNKKTLDGAGGFITQAIDVPVWVDPITADGATNMKGAFEMAKEIIEKWIADKPKNPAPVIINISDGVPYFDGLDPEICMQQTLDVVNQIKSITTEDGKIQIFNAMIGEAEKCSFPKSTTDISGREAEFLYNISTELPECYRSVGSAKFEMSIQEGARGMISKADGIELISLIDFGSSKGQTDMQR